MEKFEKSAIYIILLSHLSRNNKYLLSNESNVRTGGTAARTEINPLPTFLWLPMIIKFFSIEGFPCRDRLLPIRNYPKSQTI